MSDTDVSSFYIKQIWHTIRKMYSFLAPFVKSDKLILQLMVDAVLEIMQKAVVPWSNVVEKLVQHYLEMEGPKYVGIVVFLFLFFFCFFAYFSC